MSDRRQLSLQILRALLEEHGEAELRAMIVKLTRDRGSECKRPKRRKTAEDRRRHAERADWLMKRNGHYPPRHGRDT